MKIQSIALSALRPYENNPRQNQAAVQAVAKSLSQFGWQQPIVVDASMTIIVGHTRYLAAQHLAMDSVPVVVAKNLTPEQVRAYRIADNKTGEEAEWDDKLLALELGDLQLTGYDLTLTGFESSELDELLKSPDVYEPVLNPHRGGADVTQTDLARTAENMASAFTERGRQNIVTVDCPHCSHSFGLNKDAL